MGIARSGYLVPTVEKLVNWGPFRFFMANGLWLNLVGR